jgi:hypothetical protein
MASAPNPGTTLLKSRRPSWASRYEEGPEPRDRPILGVGRAPDVGVEPPIADLRDEAVVGPEVLADVAQIGVEVPVGELAIPPQPRRVVGETAAVPLLGQVGTLRRAALAPQELS